MKHLLTSLLLLFSLNTLAQTTVVTGPKKKPQTTTPAKPKPVTPAAKPQAKQTPKASGAKVGNVFSVKTAEEFVNAIGSNRTIRVTSRFDLTPTLLSLVAKNKIMRSDSENRYYSNAGVYAQDTYDEMELVLYNIHNLTIEGVNMATAHIQTEHYGAFVLVLESCSNVKLENLTLGHVEQGICMGGVVEMNNSKNCTINNCDLYGCGTYGICADNSDYCTFDNSTIRDCSYGIMILNGCSNFHFTNSKFIRNKEFDLINISNSTNVDFTNCNISQNKGKLFDFNCNVLFNNCSIFHDADKMGTTNFAIRR